MKYSSKMQVINALRSQLSSNKSQIEKGISRIYEYQTISEQSARDVKLNNGVGFTPADAYILSSFAQQINKGRHLSEKQMNIAKRLMPKYAGQLIEQSINKGLIQKTKEGYVFSGAKKIEPKKEETTWTETDERRWIEYKNEFARREAEQEAEAFRAKMEYENFLNRR